MFERVFSWTMRNGSRLLFVAAVLMLFAGLVRLVLDGFWEWESQFHSLLYGYLSPAAYLLFGAVLTDRIRHD